VDIVKVVDASIRLVYVKKRRRDKIEVVDNIREDRGYVEVPISSAIADYKTLKV